MGTFWALISVFAIKVLKPKFTQKIHPKELLNELFKKRPRSSQMSERYGPNFAPGSFARKQSIRLVYMLRALSRGRNHDWAAYCICGDYFSSFEDPEIYGSKIRTIYCGFWLLKLVLCTSSVDSSSCLNRQRKAKPTAAASKRGFGKYGTSVAGDVEIAIAAAVAAAAAAAAVLLLLLLLCCCRCCAAAAASAAAAAALAAASVPCCCCCGGGYRFHMMKKRRAVGRRWSWT